MHSEEWLSNPSPCIAQKEPKRSREAQEDVLMDAEKKPIRDEATSPKKAFGRVMDESWVNAEPWCGGGRLYATLYIKTFFSHTPSSPTYSYLLPSSPLSSFRHPPTANGLYSQVAVQLQISASVPIYILFATRSPAHHVCRRSAHDPSFREGRE